MRSLKKWLLYSFYTLLALPLLGIIYQQTMTFLNADHFPAPGTFVTHGDTRLHLVCKGTGTPTVFFETGLGSDSLATWSTITDTIAKRTKTCFYDRAGYGWSDAATTTRSRDNLAAELKSVIDHARGTAPVVLVAHSFGGPVARAYASRYRGDVQGMIFIDTNHENQSNLFPAELLPNGNDALRYYGPYFGIARLLASSFVIPSPDAPEGTYERLLERFASAKFHHAVLGEIKGEKAASKPLDGARYDFSNMPITVLSRDPDLVKGSEAWLVEIEAQWAGLQAELTSLSNITQHTTIPGAGHGIPATHPAAIVAAIEDMVKLSNQRRDG